MIYFRYIFFTLFLYSFSAIANEIQIIELHKNKSLDQLLDNRFHDKFKYKLISENVKYRKPDIRFYEHLLQDWSLRPEDILYIGDSIKLDIEPALKLGINAYLIDRNNYFPFVKNRIRTLNDLPNIIAKINE